MWLRCCLSPSCLPTLLSHPSLPSVRPVPISFPAVLSLLPSPVPLLPLARPSLPLLLLPLARPFPLHHFAILGSTVSAALGNARTRFIHALHVKVMRRRCCPQWFLIALSGAAAACRLAFSTSTSSSTSSSSSTFLLLSLPLLVSLVLHFPLFYSSLIFVCQSFLFSLSLSLLFLFIFF